jgi:hypothetical protein
VVGFRPAPDQVARRELWLLTGIVAIAVVLVLISSGLVNGTAAEVLLWISFPPVIAWALVIRFVQARRIFGRHDDED